MQDTIAAISTAPGRAALAVVRLSGPDALRVAASAFVGADLARVEARTAHFGRALSGNGSEIDQVVATVFHAPQSFTGEDLVEMSCHGGEVAPRLILQSLLARGARPALPGEFTQRAFLNGKLDLAQAEAVADLIHASSSLAHRVSLSQLEGRYSEWLTSLREELLEMTALVELELDFSEEDVDFADRRRLEALLARSASLLERLLGSYGTGRLIREGVRVVIGGRPNAGKSTLLNALLGRERAIVSEVPGTTRDTVEADTEIDGFLFRFTDTAGLRDTEDLVELEGVRRAEHAIEGADVLLYVFDLSQGLDEGERSFLRRSAASPVPVVLIGNKADLVPAAPPGDWLALTASRAREDETLLAPVRARLIEAAGADAGVADRSPVVVNERHRRHLASALEAVRRAATALGDGLSGDLLAVDLHLALRELGSITGEITNEDVLDGIFSRFCIGK